MPTTPEATSHHSLRKLSILLPHRAIQNHSFHYETPCTYSFFKLNTIGIKRQFIFARAAPECLAHKKKVIFQFLVNGFGTSKGTKLYQTHPKSMSLCDPLDHSNLFRFPNPQTVNCKSTFVCKHDILEWLQPTIGQTVNEKIVAIMCL